MSGNRNERAVGFTSAGELALIGPELRLVVVDIDALVFGDGFRRARLSRLVAFAAGIAGLRGVGGSEHLSLRQEVHVVINFIIHLPIRDAMSDRVRVIGKIQMHRRFEPFGSAVAP